MRRAGAATTIEDSEFTGERLFRETTQLLEQPELLRQMSENARRLAKAGAAVKAANALEAAAAR
jgi:UDP-N-acetylglucosamine:LPS N-acetylglucosamine transferase